MSLPTLFYGDSHQRTEFIVFKGQLGGEYFHFIGKSLVAPQTSSLRLVPSVAIVVVGKVDLEVRDAINILQKIGPLIAANFVPTDQFVDLL